MKNPLCFHILLLGFIVLPLVRGQFEAPPRLFSEHIGGIALRHLNPRDLVQEMIDNESIALQANQNLGQNYSGGGGGIGIANARWMLTLELPESQWVPFKAQFETGIHRILRNAGAGGNLNGGGSRDSHTFNGYKNFQYMIKEDEGALDVAGYVDILYLSTGEGKVAIVVHAFEVEMDMDARIERVANHQENLRAHWAAHPTAGDVRARQDQPHGEKARAFQQEDAADLVVHFETVDRLSIRKPELDVHITRPAHLQSLAHQEIGRDLVVVILGKRVNPERRHPAFEDELVTTFHELGFQRVIVQAAQGDLHPDGRPILRDVQNP